MDTKLKAFFDMLDDVSAVQFTDENRAAMVLEIASRHEVDVDAVVLAVATAIRVRRENLRLPEYVSLWMHLHYLRQSKAVDASTDYEVREAILTIRTFIEAQL